MNYRLRLNIGNDGSRGTWDDFLKERENFYKSILKRFKTHQGRIDDIWVELPNGTPEVAKILSQISESNRYNYDIGVFVDYTPKEIEQARFVPLMALGNYVDRDKNHKFLNTYSKIECSHCMRPDYNCLPDPYFIHEIVMKKKKDIYYAENGMMILSERAFDWLRNDIGPWVDFGSPCIVDNERNIISDAPKHFWIRPKFVVGRYVNEEILQRCAECGEPIQIAKGTDGDIFERGKEVIESFCETKAPIVRTESWFGYFPPGSAHSRSYEVFVSGWLHEKIRKLKLRGFVKADYAIHAADEPYEWDPLKDYHPCH